ncbi:Protein of unknown function [Bacillus cytotoxicus]|uniref:Uncharacterized protein n=1 Tax=Bacillus cytotoxicus TaxID=580165 RepID=A0AAX2CBK7_9BACI|nr:Protein of unknown function [Bacillus cytotoxicus]SCN29590.1 Protein of unknown function [Bacillus cytotoxicus]
MINVDCEGEFE